ncbi:ribbon-helix-helix protein, CopG family [Dermacoccaceae bacterium W4C1]
MAMNLRLDEASAHALDHLARATGKSKNDLINEAVLEKAARSAQTEEVRALARRAIKDYDNLLERLSQ